MASPNGMDQENAMLVLLVQSILLPRVLVQKISVNAELAQQMVQLLVPACLR